MRNPTLGRMARHGTLAASFMLLTGAALAQGTATPTTTGAGNNAASPNGMAASGGMGSAMKAKKSADAGFMKKAAQNNATEIEASKLALTKASSADVKTFAQQMIDDHSKTGDEMKALATSKGVEVADKPSIVQAAKIKLLSAMSGASFDKRYADVVGVSAHKDTVKLFQKEASNGKDADVKAWAAKTLPALQHHLEMAQTLKTSTTGKAG